METVNKGFGQGNINKHIIDLAFVMIIGQLINVLYNIVDRMYLAHMPEMGTNAMSAIGLCLPLITLYSAFANLVGTGGSPMCCIARGGKNDREAILIVNNAFVILIVLGIVLTVIGLLFHHPILLMLGASEATIGYARDYAQIYLLGTIFMMITLGMHNFINGQGFGRIAMRITLLGAIINLILDPIFLYVFDLGVSGVAIATVIAQIITALVTVKFFVGNHATVKLSFKDFRFDFRLCIKMMTLGMAGFIMSVSTSLVTMITNASLSVYGGDIYIAIMTVINSIREVFSCPLFGVSHASQPVLGYNYGAKNYHRIYQGMKFVALTCFVMGFVIWILITIFPEVFIHIFSSDPLVISKGVTPIRWYFLGFFMLGFQMASQSIAVGLGKSPQAIFFSLFRKVIIIIPLTIILPRYLGVEGVFISEAIGNFVGGLVCLVITHITIVKDVRNEELK